MTDSTPDDTADENTCAEAASDDTQSSSATPASTSGSADRLVKEGATPDARPVSRRGETTADGYDDTADDADADHEYDDEDDVKPSRPARRKPGSGRTTPRPPASRLAPQAAPAQKSAAAATATTVVITLVIVALLAVSILFGALWLHTKHKLDDTNNAAADRAHAEKIAADYAAGASTFDYRDLTPWRSALTKGTSADLTKRMEATVGAMNQLLQPLQWVSNASVLDAVVNSQSGSEYKVSAYVKVTATNVQAPSGREVTVVYNVTVDKNQNWLITDVGGMDGIASTVNGQDGATPTPSSETPSSGAPAPTATAPVGTTPASTETAPVQPVAPAETPVTTPTP